MLHAPTMREVKRLILPPAPVGEAQDGSVFFVGTATVILRYGGFTILTDPNFLHAGDHVHLGYGLTSMRRTNPAMELEDLPPIDFVLLSHLHEDHFDRVVAAKLDKSLPIITTPHAARGLLKMGFLAPTPLSTWESIEVRKGASCLRLTSTPARHGPPVISLLLPQVMGSLIEIQSPGEARPLRIYISGDTLVYDDIREIPRRFPDIDLALLHLGGTRLLGVLVTMDAEQGVEAIRIVDPALAIPIHYDDYTVFKSSVADFLAAVNAAGLANKVRVLRRGETYSFDAARLRARRERPPVK
jgi:L-ascorbate metabolism protein UlaG (beta-lactamase superfamily)